MSKENIIEHIGEDKAGYHTPVLLAESIEGLAIKPNGVYVDCTFGGGGHSRAILDKLDENGRLFAFDQDEDALANIPEDKRITFVPQNFRYIQRFLKLHKITKVDGVLADLGVSSHQFDEGDRGFSIRFDGPLDMRMDKRQPLTASQIIGTYPERKLQLVFEKYGEVTNAKTLAKLICEVREHMQVRTILQFKAMISPIVKGNPNKYLAQVFQALRMEVNSEMEVLAEMLLQLNEVVATGGRVSIITFHSIEDKIVKQFFRDSHLRGLDFENPFVQHAKGQLWEAVHKKPVLPSEAELKSNRRSRSAKLRVAERV